MEGRPFFWQGWLTGALSASAPRGRWFMRRILVVDDDRHTRLAIGIWLKQCGFRVAITDGGESGLAALNDGTFDLMIVDVFMPTSVPPNISRERANTG